MIVTGVTRDVVQQHGKELGVMFRALDALPANARPLRAPRIGLYKSWLANMDEGWTRWLLEQYEFTFKNLSNDDIRGDLSQFDVILFADETEDEILNGHAPGTMPDQYVGGIGVDGAANLRKFVERGGWVVAWDHAADFAIMALGLPLRNTVKTTRPSEFFIPGIADQAGSGAGASAGGRRGDEAGQPRDRDVRRLAGVHDRAAGRGRQAARGAARRCVRALSARRGFIARQRLAARRVALHRGPRRRRARAGRQGERGRHRLPSALARPAAQHVQTAVQSAVRINEFDAHFKYSLIDPICRESACRLTRM